MSGSNGTGHCGDCETTEQQLRVGAVNIVRENETRLTNALKVRIRGFRGLSEGFIRGLSRGPIRVFIRGLSE